MLLDIALGFVNHLLNDEDWARNRLKLFAGQTVRFELGTLNCPLEISSEGYFQVCVSHAAPAVTLALPADAVLRALTERTTLLSSAQIRGSAQLAECLRFIFSNLRWDVESDLAQVVGDIAARRIVQSGKKLVQWQQLQTRNLTLNVAEYLSEETPVIASKSDISGFCNKVRCTQQELDRIEKRIELLER